MPTITTANFEGLAAVEITTPGLRLVAVSAFGPRIAWLGKPGGQNLLLWQPGKYRRHEWDLRGGHRVWVTRPGADECEDTYATDNAPCETEILPDGFRLTGAENPANRTRRGFAVTVLDAHTLRVDNFLRNTGDLLYSGGIWALTCTVPAAGTRYGIPVGDGTEWDAYSQVLFRRWAGHGAGGFADAQFQQRADLLTLTPQGAENKRMIQSQHGIVAMSHPTQDVTFAKRTPWLHGRAYPLNTNVALYIGPQNFMVEMESMGPEQPLRPGESLHHVETWTLRPGAAKLEQARELLDLFA